LKALNGIPPESRWGLQNYKSSSEKGKRNEKLSRRRVSFCLRGNQKRV